jgi:hypothetical protein
MSIDHTALSAYEISDVGCQLSDPNTITRCTGSQAPWIITIYIRVFVVPQSIDVICLSLCDTGCRIHAIDEFAWEGF